MKHIALLISAMVVVATCLNASSRADQTAGLSKDRLVALAAAYVSAYQQDFAFLIAAERTVQEAFGTKESARVPLAARTTRGEIFITFLQGRRHWTTVRDVTEVDGVTVANRVDLPELLSRQDPDDVARRLFGLNARYNIGGVVRNFNDPMIALLALSDVHRPRFTFDLAKAAQSEPGIALATLTFRERERPTIVRSASGGAVYARGAITLDAKTGVIRRTQFAVRYDDITAELVTDFALEERVKLWVPSTLSERYTAKADGFEDLITSSSRYSNFRRFAARGRLLATRPAIP